MRRGKALGETYKVMVVDDDLGIIDSISILLQRKGYEYVGVTNPVDAIEKLRNEKYDLMILDYIMEPLNGDEVVEEVRKFDPDIYILFLTGHKDLAPPLETLENFDIQGYCEKSDKFDQLTLFIESAIKTIAQKRTIAKFKDGLNKIIEAIPKIYQLQPIDDILKEILTQLMPLVYSSNAFILADDINLDKDKDKKSIFSGIGNYNTDINTFMGNLSIDFMDNIGKARSDNKIMELESGVIIPLTIENGLNLGVIYIESTEYQDGLKLLNIYANQAAAAINNAYMHSIVNIKNDELNATYAELKKRYMDAIETLRLTVDAKDYYTRGHSDRVAYYAEKIGRAMELSDEEIETLKIGGIFHDIGKIGTNDDILLKNAKLDDAEYAEIKKHPVKGANILSAMSMFKDVVPLVKYHHERYDGRGYPEGLKGDEIPFLARIISVADAFDAMTSDRVYRTKLELSTAIEQLVNGRGTQFDPEIVNVFVKLLDNYDEMRKDLSNTYAKVVEGDVVNA
ncbi:MAG: HD domain-containing response regulator [Clostridia bacterium]|nr:HD domain-containing response regulator [Clostridia bacterium]